MLFFLMALFPLVSNAQEQNGKDIKNEPGQGYIAKVDTIISIKLNVNSEYDQFEVRGNDFFYDIRPNITLSSRVAFSYRFISFGIGFKPKFIPGNNDNDLQGKTQTLSFGVNIQSNHWIQELQFGYVTGFYLHNTADYAPTPDWTKGEDPYIQFPELKVAMLRGATGYKFNKNFSLKAISSKTEIQLKSCGSFIPFLVYDYFEIDNQDADTNQRSSQKSNNFNLLTSFGYFYTFVLKSKFYASIGLFPAIGWQHTKLLTRYPGYEIPTTNNAPLFRMQEKAGIGYNTRRFFAGAELSLSQSSHKQENTNVQEKALRTYFQVFFGYRFNAPGFLKHETDRVKSIAPSPIQHILE